MLPITNSHSEADAYRHSDSDRNAYTNSDSKMDAITYTFYYPDTVPYFPVAFPLALVNRLTISYANAYGITDPNRLSNRDVHANFEPDSDTYRDSYPEPDSDFDSYSD